MAATPRILEASRHILRPSQGLSTSQSRFSERQWPRNLSTRSNDLRRPTSRKTPLLRTTRRHQSTTAAPGSRVLNLVYGTGLVVFSGAVYLYVTDTRASVHQWLLVPALRLFHADPEDAHHAGVRYIKGLYYFNLHPRERGKLDQHLGDLQVEVFGHILNNPIGTSAGIDKNAEIPSPLLALGPAIVEVGGVTPRPQEGNAKPRVFRIPSQNALINRYGLNSKGAEHVAMQLRQRVREYAYDNGLGLDPESERIVLDGEADVPPGSLVPGKLLAVQIAKNKTTPDNDIDAIANDYVTCVNHLAKYADIMVVNVSSPNTPGLRDLQAVKPLTAILTAVVNAVKNTDRKSKPAVMVKVSPDEDSEAQIDGICTAIWDSGVDGVIVGNTTNKRPDPIPRGYILPASEEKLLTEMGGYSGPQMFERTLSLVKRYRSKLDQRPVEEEPKMHRFASQRSEKKAPPPVPSPTRDDSIDVSLQRDAQRLKPVTPGANTQDEDLPLLRIPGRHLPDTAPAQPAVPVEVDSPLNPTPDRPSQPSVPVSRPPARAPSPLAPSSPPARPAPSSLSEPKVLFATGGITTGEQCLQILNAGASVCQIYTAMMYEGVGTVTRMKGEMREVMKRSAAR